MAKSDSSEDDGSETQADAEDAPSSADSAAADADPEDGSPSLDADVDAADATNAPDGADADAADGTDAPVELDSGTQKSYKLCPAGEMHTLQCVGGEWKEMIAWDYPCYDGG